ncbi:unnamed protein product [Phytophthora fragariaefolia]|uniref:Unnamed protein product n=1 Tax=Phytophthora fragariaefolia TaxID=1490495 RepID=A0A9W7CS80_9STRA|nr:unnamed protein product [Phytophthora fragariaefolia]
MGEPHLDNEMGNDGEDEDDSYANAYLDDDALESDDAELAEMLAKVQSIQQVEGRLQLNEAPVPAVVPDEKSGKVGEDASKVSTGQSSTVITPEDTKKSQSLTKSPSAVTSTSCVGAYKSQDGITTITRSAVSARNTGAGAMLGIKKTIIYEEKLLQAVKTTNAIERLKQKVVAAAPGRNLELKESSVI